MAARLRELLIVSIFSLNTAKLVDVETHEDNLVSDLASQLSPKKVKLHVAEPNRIDEPRGEALKLQQQWQQQQVQNDEQMRMRLSDREQSHSDDRVWQVETMARLLEGKPQQLQQTALVSQSQSQGREQAEPEEEQKQKQQENGQWQGQHVQQQLQELQRLQALREGEEQLLRMRTELQHSVSSEQQQVLNQQLQQLSERMQQQRQQQQWQQQRQQQQWQLQAAGSAADNWTYGDTDAWKTIGMCGHSGDQSPIDIRRESVSYDNNLTNLSFTFNSFDSQFTAHVVTEPYTWNIVYEPLQGVVHLEGKDFQMLSVRVHSPSENAINGQHFPMEAQIVHQAFDGQLLVVAQMLGVGKFGNPFLSRVWDGFPNVTGEGPFVTAGNPYKELLPLDKSYYRWDGSTTTPPCKNNTIWILMQSPMMISQLQLDSYRTKVNMIPGNKLAPKASIPGLDGPNFSKLLGTNNRPLQPLVGRVVQGFSNFVEQPCSNTPSPEMIMLGQSCIVLETESLEKQEQLWLSTFPNRTAACTSPSNPRLFDWMEQKYCQRSCFALGLGYTGDKCTLELPTDSLCTDEIAPEMNTTCENADLTTLCSSFKEKYRLELMSKKYCQKSCYFYGNGYQSDVC